MFYSAAADPVVHPDALAPVINKTGVAVIMVEQNANMALSIADRGYVLQTGSIVLADSARNLLDNTTMKQAYLDEGALGQIMDAGRTQTRAAGAQVDAFCEAAREAVRGIEGADDYQPGSIL